jgi:molybdate transport system regulatory protein
VGVRLRLVLGPDVAIGPGKAALLAAIRDAGSISGGGRALAMSYKRAWLLVDSMNRCFKEPLVVSSRGGSVRGGAQLTGMGERVLASFTRAQALAEEALAAEVAALRDMALPAVAGDSRPLPAPPALDEPPASDAPDQPD